MEKILVTYVTISGSTTEVAYAVGEEIANKGFQVEVLPIEKVVDLKEYATVVLGAPMRVGWHRSAVRFLKRHNDTFSKIPLAIFVMGVNFSSRGETDVQGVPIYLDPKVVKSIPAGDPVTLHERFSSVTQVAAPILKATASVKPISIGFFGGRLDYQRLKLLDRLFVMVVIRAQAGERRDWNAIRSWASSLPDLLGSQNMGA